LTRRTLADADLHIDCRAHDGGWLCRVTVSDGASFTEHEVSVSQAELTRYGADSTSLVALVSESFAFLLDREPKESILRKFAISDIETYFPEFGRR
jgi:hypothetical protein